MTSGKEVKMYFNNIAHIYDRFKIKNRYYYDYIKNMISDITSNFFYSSILDIGCGTGEILNHLNPERGVGIDISSKMIFFAKKKFKKYNFIASDFKNIHLTNKFDLILLIDVIEHLEDLNKSLSRIRDFAK